VRGKPADLSIWFARLELERFLNIQNAEALRLGYPNMATFARDIARGDIGMPPRVEEDRVLDIVAVYFNGLGAAEKDLLTALHLYRYGLRKCCRILGLPFETVRRKQHNMLKTLANLIS